MITTIVELISTRKSGFSGSVSCNVNAVGISKATSLSVMFRVAHVVGSFGGNTKVLSIVSDCTPMNNEYRIQDSIVNTQCLD